LVLDFQQGVSTIRRTSLPTYPFALYEWQFKGLSEETALIPITNVAVSPALLLEWLQYAEPQHLAEDTETYRSSLDELEKAHYSRWSSARSDHQQRVERLSNFRRESLATSHKARMAICPGNNESGGKKFSGATRNGNPHLMANMVEGAWAATRKKNCHFKSTYYGVRARRGAKRAIVAVAHGLLRTIFVVLKSGHPYCEPMRTPLPEQQRITKAQRLCARLRNMGFNVILKPQTKPA
jgi:hypothetical protein